MQEIDRKKAVVAILEEQNELLDRILSGQLKIRRTSAATILLGRESRRSIKIVFPK